MISFSVVGGDGVGSVGVAEPSVAIVGYAGRDEAAVDAHVRELAELGVAPPESVPAVWDVPGSLLTQSGAVSARAGASSGEVEPVLVLAEEGWFLTVGSDHTDRKLEAESMQAAKQACAKAVGRAAVPLDLLGPSWDSVSLVSSVRVDGSWVSYQRGLLSEIRPLSWYVERFAGCSGLVVFCGTVPTVGSLRTDADGFRAGLCLPDGTELSVEYEMVLS